MVSHPLKSVFVSPMIKREKVDVLIEVDNCLILKYSGPNNNELYGCDTNHESRKYGRSEYNGITHTIAHFLLQKGDPFWARGGAQLAHKCYR